MISSTSSIRARALFPSHTVEATEELEVLPGGQVRINGELLRDEPDLRLGVDALRSERSPVDDNLAVVAFEQAADHRYRRRLARAVGA